MLLFKQTVLFSIIFVGIQAENVDLVLRNFTTHDSRIVGGMSAINIDLPWQVSVINDKQPMCGGSIISEKVIITAAHCLEDIEIELIEVLVGAKYATNGTLYSIDKWKVHQQYNKEYYLDYDIALIFLKQKIQFEDHKIEPIKLAKFKSIPEPDTLAIVSGWGQISNGTYPEILQYAMVPVLSNDLCRKSYAEKFNPQSMICAGYLDGVTDACAGDSGGPLVANNRLIGVVSFGEGCGKPDKPGVYASIPALRMWIDWTVFKCLYSIFC